MLKNLICYTIATLTLVAGALHADETADLQTLKAQLEAARKNLRISEATERKIEQDMELLKQRENIDPAVLEDYNIYLERVRGLRKQHAEMVRQMEAIYAKVAPPGEEPPADPGSFEPSIPEQLDELKRLDQELNVSLAKFDDYINDQMAQAAQRMKDLSEVGEEERTGIASEAAEAVKRLRERGIDVETELPEEGAEGEGEGKGADGEDEENGDGTEREGEGAGGGDEADAEEGKGGQPGSETEGEPGEGDGEQAGNQSDNSSTLPGGGGKMTPGGLPGGQTTTGQGRGSAQGAPGAGVGPKGERAAGADVRGNRSDDDIVARQLREAAENEADPVLREKLWKEYEEYKKGL